MSGPRKGSASWLVPTASGTRTRRPRSTAGSRASRALARIVARSEGGAASRTIQSSMSAADTPSGSPASARRSAVARAAPATLWRGRASMPFQSMASPSALTASSSPPGGRVSVNARTTRSRIAAHLPPQPS